jgi:hypothetical protein
MVTLLLPPLVTIAAEPLVLLNVTVAVVLKPPLTDDVKLMIWFAMVPLIVMLDPVWVFVNEPPELTMRLPQKVIVSLLVFSVPPLLIVSGAVLLDEPIVKLEPDGSVMIAPPEPFTITPPDAVKFVGHSAATTLLPDEPALYWSVAFAPYVSVPLYVLALAPFSME